MFVCRAVNPPVFDLAAAAMPARDAAPLIGRFGRAFYPSVFDRARDVSLIEIAQGRPLALLPATVQDGRISWYGQPIRIIGEPGDAKALVRALVDLARQFGASEVCLRTEANGQASALEAALLGQGARASLQTASRVALDGQLEAGLRRRYRSHVNWGRRNLTLTYPTDRAAVRMYQDFHAHVAGRVTRPPASWDAMADCIAEGLAELTLVHDAGGTLLGGIYVALGEREAFYASGAYERSRFDDPLSHWPMFDAIERAARRGLAVFDVGEMPYMGEVGAKEYAIGHFKAGFVRRPTFDHIWTLPVEAAKAEQLAA
jgi:hypothetical protein